MKSITKKYIAALIFILGGAGVATKLIAVAPPPMSSCTVSSGVIADSNTDICLVEPDKYKITIYEIGLCKSAPGEPTTSAAVDLSNCSAIFTSAQGQEISVVTGAATSLPTSMITPPPVGAYTHGYVINSPTFKVSGVFTFESARTPKYAGSGTGVGTKCWTKTGTIFSYASARTDMPFDCGTSPPASVGEITASVNSFGGTSAVFDYQSIDSAGTTKAFLVTDEKKLASSAAADTLGSGATAVSKLFGTVTLPVNVSGGSQTIDIGFGKTKGAAVVPDSVVGGVKTIYGLYSGPPSMTMQVK